MSEEDIEKELSSLHCFEQLNDNTMIDIKNDVLSHDFRRPSSDEIQVSHYVDNKFLNFINYDHLKFLYIAYEPQYWYWEILETFRRLLFTAFIVISSGTSPNLQVSKCYYWYFIHYFVII